MTDDQLVERIKNGDESAFKELMELYIPKIKTVVKHQYRLSDADIEDAVQIASLKIWQKIHAFRGDSSFMTWVFTIIRNEVLNVLKKRAASLEVPAHRILNFDNIESEDGDYEHVLHSSIDDKLQENARIILERQETLKIYKEVIEEVLNKLTHNDSQIIRLVLEENRSYKEIAEMLNIPVGTVMSRLCYARRRARKLLSQYAKQNELQFSCLG